MRNGIVRQASANATHTAAAAAAASMSAAGGAASNLWPIQLMRGMIAAEQESGFSHTPWLLTGAEAKTSGGGRVMLPLQAVGMADFLSQVLGLRHYL